MFVPNKQGYTGQYPFGLPKTFPCGYRIFRNSSLHFFWETSSLPGGVMLWAVVIH